MQLINYIILNFIDFIITRYKIQGTRYKVQGTRYKLLPMHISFSIYRELFIFPNLQNRIWLAKPIFRAKTNTIKTELNMC